MEDARAALVGTLADAHIGALPFIIHEQAEHIEELSRRLESVASFVQQLHEGLLEAAEESRANVETAENAAGQVGRLIEAQRTQLGGAGYSVWELEMLDAQEQASTSMRHGQDRVHALARDLQMQSAELGMPYDGGAQEEDEGTLIDVDEDSSDDDLSETQPVLESSDDDETDASD